MILKMPQFALNNKEYKYKIDLISQDNIYIYVYNVQCIILYFLKSRKPEIS